MQTIKNLSRGGKIALAIMVPTVILAIYIMANSLGLSDTLDFGAGAYFYADMPGFERWTSGNAYHSPVPMWALIVLFLIWGRVIWRFWVWLDKRMQVES